MKKQNFSKVAANVLDSTLKDNTLKTIEQIKNDASYWLPMVNSAEGCVNLGAFHIIAESGNICIFPREYMYIP